MHGIIYTITNRINGKQYVGQTTGSVERRWAKHIRNAFAGENGCRALESAIRKYGPNAFEVEAVVACDSQGELDRMESMCIKAGYTLSPDGYNLRTGGNGGSKASAETCARISEAAKRRMTPEYLAKLSRVHRGQRHSDATRAKLSEVHRGKRFSTEHRAKISDARRGQRPSAETRAKMSEVARNRTTEHQAKLNEAARHMTPDHRAKLSEAARARWAREKEQGKK